MQPPVRIYALIAASLMVFAFSFGWGRAARTHQAEAANPPPEPPPTAATGESPGPQEPKPEPAKPAQPTTRTVPSGGTTHMVQRGETLFSLGRLYGVTVSDIRLANGLKTDQIKAGQTLLIPGSETVRRHIVEEGDSFWELAIRYGVDLEALLAANKDVEPGHMSIGTELVIPAGSGSGGGAGARSVIALPGGSGLQEALKGLFAWPSDAGLSSEFGPRWGRNHNGIDLAANHGDPITASRDGEVLLAGTVSGYGETIVLQHADGTRTLYAHASKLMVRSAQKVKQGDLIALVGSTGQSTGPHLHFEIIINDRPVNPLDYLPSR